MQFESGDVERKRRDGEQHIIGGESRFAPHGLQKVHHRPMRDLDAFRFAGGAAGVENVSEMGRLRLCRRGGRGGGRGQRLIDEHVIRRRLGQRREQRPLGDQHRGVGVLQHKCDTVSRVRGIDRDVGTAGFENTEDAHHHVEGTLDAQADQNIRAHPA